MTLEGNKILTRPTSLVPTIWREGIQPRLQLCYVEMLTSYRLRRIDDLTNPSQNPHRIVRFLNKILCSGFKHFRF